MQIRCRSRDRRHRCHHLPERASEEVPGCGTHGRPIPLPASTRSLARFASAPPPSPRLPLAARDGFASSGRGPEGRRCPVATATVDAGVQRVTVRYTKGHPARRTLTPKTQLSTSAKRQPNVRLL